MMKKRRVVGLSVLLVSMLWAAVGFALDVPPGNRFQKDTQLSENALNIAIAQFSTLKAELSKLVSNLPPEKLQERQVVEETITLVEGKLSRLDRIDVYFPVALWSWPEDPYNYLYDFYVTQGKVSSVQDVNETEVIAMVDNLFLIPVDPKYQTTANSLNNLVNQDPSRIPAEYRDLKIALDNLVSAEKVKAATGIPGKSRISIVSFYINPDEFPNVSALIETPALVIATDK